MDETTVTVTLTMAFTVEEPMDDDEAKEYALEWIGSVSDSFLRDGLEVTTDDPVP
jgi:hypothetical protein